MDHNGLITIKGKTLIIRFTTEKFITKQYLLETIKQYLEHDKSHFLLVKSIMGMVSCFAQNGW